MSDRCVVDLGRGRSLTIRPAEPGDVAGLAELYESLDLEDRHRRFFSAYHPSQAFLERVVRAVDRGGVELVAVLEGGDGPAVLVGEAGFELLASGDGELAVTVRREWRGWLGAYLLSRLLAAAADRGVPNLEADVLVTNGPMLALAHAHGAVDMDQPDWTMVRLLIGTGSEPPVWPPADDRPRVLVEGSGGGWRARRERGLPDVAILACPGPGRRQGGCPALEGRPCPLAAGADVIVAPETDDGPWPALVRAHEELEPGVPVCLVAPGAAHGSDQDATVVGLAQRHHRRRPAPG